MIAISNSEVKYGVQYCFGRTGNPSKHGQHRPHGCGNGLQSAFDKTYRFRYKRQGVEKTGLDYWHLTDFIVYENLEEFFDKNADGRVHKTTDGSWHIDGNDERTSAPHFYFCSTKAAKRYDEAKFGANDFLFFGRESKGLPEELLHDNYDMTIRIPMVKEARSLNLSNSVAIVVYEGMRQLGFENLLCKGHLTKF